MELSEAMTQIAVRGVATFYSLPAGLGKRAAEAHFELPAGIGRRACRREFRARDTGSRCARYVFDRPDRVLSR